MLETSKPYAIVYRVTGKEEVEECFSTEKDLHEYCKIWLDYPAYDYVDYFEYDRGYTPSWAWV